MEIDPTEILLTLTVILEIFRSQNGETFLNAGGTVATTHLIPWPRCRPDAFVELGEVIFFYMH